MNKKFPRFNIKKFFKALIPLLFSIIISVTLHFFIIGNNIPYIWSLIIFALLFVFITLLFYYFFLLYYGRKSKLCVVKLHNIVESYIINFDKAFIKTNLSEDYLKEIKDADFAPKIMNLDGITHIEIWEKRVTENVLIKTFKYSDIKDINKMIDF